METCWEHSNTLVVTLRTLWGHPRDTLDGDTLWTSQVGGQGGDILGISWAWRLGGHPPEEIHCGERGHNDTLGACRQPSRDTLMGKGDSATIGEGARGHPIWGNIQSGRPLGDGWTQGHQEAHKDAEGGQGHHVAGGRQGHGGDRIVRGGGSALCRGGPRGFQEVFRGSQGGFGGSQGLLNRCFSVSGWIWGSRGW